jgi:hypothetical protein
MKHLKAHLLTKKNGTGVRILIGALMEMEPIHWCL